MSTTSHMREWNMVQQARLIGHTALMREGQFHFPVKIMAGKTSYGDFRLKVTPVGGTGLEWVSSDRLTLTDETLRALDAGCPTASP